MFHFYNPENVIWFTAVFIAQKMKFSIKEKISVKVSKSVGNCGFGHICLRNF